MIKIFPHKGLNGFLEAFIHGLTRRLSHAADMVEVGGVLYGYYLLSIFVRVKRKRILNTVSELEFLPNHASSYGVAMHTAIPHAFLIGVNEGAVIII